jgi:hypothetical protein
MHFMTANTSARGESRSATHVVAAEGTRARDVSCRGPSWPPPLPRRLGEQGNHQ